MNDSGWRARRGAAFQALRGLCALVALAALAACAPLAPRQPGPGDEAASACRAAFSRADAAIAQARVADAMARRIDGFPYLRVDRFLASFADEVDDDARFPAWRMRLRELDRQARSIELRNLPAPSRAALAAALHTAGDAADLNARLDACAGVLMASDDAVSGRRQQLRDSAHVPDDYDTWKRVAGAYWLTRLPFSAGVADYQREVMRTFVAPLDALPVRGRLRAYSAPRLAAQGSEPVVRDTLGIPRPSDAMLAALFAAHAPDWIVDEAGPDDRIGALALAGSAVRVDPGTPVVYRRLAYTRLGDEALMQLVYSAWFPARPRGGAIDLLAGHLDSVVWRVTLDRDGVPLLYDSMHGCGCYHQFFPTARLRALPQRSALEEGALVPQMLGEVAPGQRVRLRIAAGTHYLQRVLVDAAPAESGVTYALHDDDALRALPAGDGATRSAFGQDGIVAGSHRGERYLDGRARAGRDAAVGSARHGLHGTAPLRRGAIDRTLLRAPRRVIATPCEGFYSRCSGGCAR